MDSHTLDAPVTSSGRRWWKPLLVVAVVAGLAAGATQLPKSRPRVAGEVSTHRIERGELLVTVTEQGTLESANNSEIKCKVRGDNTIIWVVESGAEVQPGDELVRLDTLLIEEEISERTKFAHLAASAVARSGADVERAKLAIQEYEQGRFVSELATLQKDLAIAESKLVSAKDMLRYAEMMADSGYISELEKEEKQFAVAQAGLDVELTNTQIDVLREFTKREQLATLQGELNVALANHDANIETAKADQKRLERAQDELKECVVTAQRAGMVIYPSGRAWEESPEIEEGATVHKDQVLLLMPDLAKMQVKVGIHESVIERIHTGLPANITLPRGSLKGEVSQVAAVAKPAGWWTGNVVKYDTIISVPEDTPGLKPGMSVEVEVVVAQYDDVLLIPSAAVIETKNGHACWVRVGDDFQRRSLTLGDYNDMLIEVQQGVVEGEDVVMDPLAFIPEAQEEAATTIEETDSEHPLYEM